MSYWYRPWCGWLRLHRGGRLLRRLLAGYGYDVRRSSRLPDWDCLEDRFLRRLWLWRRRCGLRALGLGLGFGLAMRWLGRGA